eukprot:PLAT15322.1.p1 GENE.PLAT15322.1~~PLAT15322.1.p1  ORF type:complete len:333 (+),score=102.48 PLAT15322.1:74-1072(+)
MGERKVLVKYYPPDFDPERMKRFKRARPKRIEVRMMLPMSIQCSTCGEFMYRGKKFNCKKEEADEKYLGLSIWRFFFKCVTCSSELTMRTDPKNADYIVEAGATRNFELWKAEGDAARSVRERREEEEDGDAMRTLENRTQDSKAEMDALDQLQELKALGDSHSKLNPDKLLQRIAERRRASSALTAEEEQQLKAVRFELSKAAVAASTGGSAVLPRPAPAAAGVAAAAAAGEGKEGDEDDEDDSDAATAAAARSMFAAAAERARAAAVEEEVISEHAEEGAPPAKKARRVVGGGTVVIRRKKKKPKAAKKKKKAAPASEEKSVGLALLAGY